MLYQERIRRLDPTLTAEAAAGVEGSMRLQYGTLDHLDERTFAQEIELAKACEAERPGFLAKVARSYGLAILASLLVVGCTTVESPTAPLRTVVVDTVRVTVVDTVTVRVPPPRLPIDLGDGTQKVPNR